MQDLLVRGGGHRVKQTKPAGAWPLAWRSTSIETEPRPWSSWLRVPSLYPRAPGESSGSPLRHEMHRAGLEQRADARAGDEAELAGGAGRHRRHQRKSDVD